MVGLATPTAVFLIIIFLFMGLRFWRCWRRACGAVNAAAGTENFTSAGRFKNRQSQAAFFFRQRSAGNKREIIHTHSCPFRENLQQYLYQVIHLVNSKWGRVENFSIVLSCALRFAIVVIAKIGQNGGSNSRIRKYPPKGRRNPYGVYPTMCRRSNNQFALEKNN